MKKLRTLLFLAFVVTPFFAFAQSSPTTSDDATNQVFQFEIQTSPQKPGPSEMVQATVTSSTDDLSVADITWTLNDKVMQVGVGKTTFSFQNGDAGQTTRLNVSILTDAGESANKDLSFMSLGAILLWEADTHTPPFYKGKAMMTPKSKVRITAIPSVSNTPDAIITGSLMYTWEHDGAPALENSGYGQNSFSFVSPQPGINTLAKVAITSLDGEINESMGINLFLGEPMVLFYEDNPLFGILFNNAFGDETVFPGKELTLVAEPYFFPNANLLEPNLSYSWSLNGAIVKNTGRTITFRNESGTKGNSVLTLTATEIKGALQSIVKSLQIHLTEDDTSKQYF